MRLEVNISDDLYGEVRRAANDSGVSLDRFVCEAVQLRLEYDQDQERVSLTPEQVDIIRQGQAEIRAGKFFTAEQVHANLEVLSEELFKEPKT